jgi:hypothetical protein
VAAAGTAFGQIWPGYYGNGYGYGYGGWGATSQYNTTRNIEAADQLSGQVIAAQQSAAMQNNIRNTMMTQAQSQTQNILNQRQSNKDWWFQVQQQQAAQRRATPSRMPPLAAPATSFEPAPVAAAPSAPVTTAAAAPADEVMQWPVALQDPRFAGLRAEIEAPYRRTPGKMSYPTREEYLAMLQPIEQMRALLGQMTGELTAREYLDAEKFLNLVAQQAQERAKPKS